MLQPPGKILLTGATGYVGGRLLRAFVEHGANIRALARRPEHLSSAMASGVEDVQGDLLDRASLTRALAGIHTAYYLVHSMGPEAITPSSIARRRRTSARQQNRLASSASFFSAGSAKARAL